MAGLRPETALAEFLLPGEQLLIAYLAYDGLDLPENGAELQHAVFGQLNAKFIQHDRVVGIAKRVAREKLAGMLGILAANRPLDLVHVTDRQRGKGDDELLLRVVGTW